MQRHAQHAEEHERAGRVVRDQHTRHQHVKPWPLGKGEDHRRGHEDEREHERAAPGGAGDGERSVNIARQGYETERIGGDYMAMYRFFVPVLPLTFALIGVAVEGAIADAEAATARRRVLEVLGTASVCGLLL